MNPQDRPARRFDEPPAYEDLELRPDIAAHVDDIINRYGGALDSLGRERENERLARHSHLGAIVIVASVVVLVVIAAALFLRGAS